METEALVDKIPPYNDDAEKAVLGSIMLNPNALSEIVRKVKAEDFYRPENQRIYAAMVELDGQETKIDLISVIESLKSKGDLERCGGAAYISALTDAVPTSANIDYYGSIVQDCSFRRSILMTASTLKKDAHDMTLKSKELVEVAEQQIFSLANRQNTNVIINSQEIIMTVMKIIQNSYNSKGNTSGIPSGFSKLDELTLGFQNQDFIVIGARPSIGKTAFALSMVRNMAFKNNIPVGFFSLEMSFESLGLRLVSAEAKMDGQKIRSGFLDPGKDFEKLGKIGPRFCAAPLFVDDTPNISLLDLRANARLMIKNHQVKIIFIDYIGLISSERGSNVPRFEQVSEISRSLKALARELNVPIVCLAQVGRQSEGEAPKLNSLRDSGSIEQDADVVMFLHRKRESDQDVNDPNSDSSSSETQLILAKHRNGPTGIVKINFVKRYALFEEFSYDQG